MQTDTAFRVDPQAGGWNEFHTGPWQGRVLRFTLEEIQKAEHGRKYGRKDKRPLDPPPVVQVKAFELVRQGSMGQVEREIDEFDEYDTLGFLCHVELVPEDFPKLATDRSTIPFMPNVPAHLARMQWPLLPRDVIPNSGAAGWLPHGPHSAPGESARPFNTRTTSRQDYGRSADLPGERVPEHGTTRSSTYCPAPPSTAPVAQASLPEENICMSLLAGETVTSCSLLESGGKMGAVFAFPDIAVRREGKFILRYRIFNLQSRTRDNGVRVLAECFGGPFQVYSTKSFPGLNASTELTRRLSLSGVRVNSRQKERRGWKRDSQQVRRVDTDRSPPYGSLPVVQHAQPQPSSSSLRKLTNEANVPPYAYGLPGHFAPLPRLAPPSTSSLPLPLPSLQFGDAGLPRPRYPGIESFIAYERAGNDAASVRGADSRFTGSEASSSTHSGW